jgi:hypothetical protein
MMVSLQRRLQTGSDEDRERQFFTHTLRYLTTSSGRQVDMEDWMITTYEVEFGHEIGSGGLYVLHLLSFGYSISLILYPCQWTSVQGELEQDNGSTEGTYDRRWCHP